jgi:hypothetical protein
LEGLGGPLSRYAYANDLFQFSRIRLKSLTYGVILVSIMNRANDFLAPFRGKVAVKRWVLIGGAALVFCAGLGFGIRSYLGPHAGTQDDAAETGGVSSDYPLAAPPLRLRVVRWDFGTATPGKELSHQLEITNLSAEPWVLKHVTSTCSCTVGRLPGKTVKPGETAGLKVTYRAPLRNGKASGRVLFEFAEPGGPMLQLNIEGEVRSLLSADPPSLEFDYVPPGTRPSRTVRLRNYADQPVKITRVEAPAWLQAEWRAGGGRGPGQTWKLVLTADPNQLRFAPESATLAVHTDASRVGSAFIPVRLKGPLEAVPEHLAFGTVAPGKTSVKKVLLRAAPDLGELTEKDVLLAHNLGDKLDVQVHQGKSPHQFVLLVRFQPKRPREEVEGVLKINTRKTAPIQVTISGAAK